MLFKNLSPGKQFIFTSSITDSMPSTYLKLDGDFLSQQYPGLDITAVALKSGVLVKITDDSEICTR